MTEFRDGFEVRDRMGMELHKRIMEHPQNGQWKEAFPATSLMLNSASHPNKKQALNMVVEDTLKAYERQAPVDIIRFALDQVIEWRQILLETQPRKDGLVEGEITNEILKDKLRKKLPQNILKELFG